MVCSNCDKKNSIEAKFCNNCGQPLNIDIPSAEPDLVMPSSLAKKQPIHRKQNIPSKVAPPLQKRKFNWDNFGLVLFILGIMSIAGAFFGVELVVNKFVRFILVLIGLAGLMAMIPWLVAGLAGGIIMTTKKLQGTLWWVWILLFGFIPVLFWLVYLAMMSLLGFWGLNWANFTNPQKRRCTQCRGWGDFKAIRCRHCGQLFSQ